jgi:hypothetical protein
VAELQDDRGDDVHPHVRRIYATGMHPGSCDQRESRSAPQPSESALVALSCAYQAGFRRPASCFGECSVNVNPQEAGVGINRLTPC